MTSTMMMTIPTKAKNNTTTADTLQDTNTKQGGQTSQNAYIIPGSLLSQDESN